MIMKERVVITCYGDGCLQNSGIPTVSKPVRKEKCELFTDKQIKIQSFTQLLKKSDFSSLCETSILITKQILGLINIS